MPGEPRELIQRIKKLQENIMVVIGVIIALTLSVYFFTYPFLVDRGLGGLLWAQAVSTLVMLLILIYLKRLSFLLARWWLRRKKEWREMLATITIEDLKRP